MHLHVFNLYIYNLYVVVGTCMSYMYLIYIYKNYMQVPTTYIAYYIVANPSPNECQFIYLRSNKRSQADLYNLSPKGFDAFKSHLNGLIRSLGA